MNNFEGYFDIHTHLLPGVDDGSCSMEETMIMIRIALSQGIQTIIATPHYAVGRKNVSVEELERIRGLVEVEAKKQNDNIRILLGNEIFYSDSIIEALNKKQALTLAGSKYVLVEFSYEESYRVIYRALAKLIRSGYIPILAHVERYYYLHKSKEAISELIKMGCYMQMNCNSLIGGIFNKRASYHRKIIDQGMIHFLASDCHDFKNRIPNMEKAVQVLLKKCDADIIDQILYENPRGILEYCDLNTALYHES